MGFNIAKLIFKSSDYRVKTTLKKEKQNKTKTKNKIRDKRTSQNATAIIQKEDESLNQELREEGQTQ